jgi:PTH1 family peptidyl-tRNA hydrolase
MNLSGKAIADLADKNAIGAEDLLVIVDDKDIELGKIKLKAKGSGGSHNGLLSIIGELGTEEFSRLKIGIGPQEGYTQLRDHVLAPFKRNERKLLDQAIEQACRCAEAWASSGASAAMNRFNS